MSRGIFSNKCIMFGISIKSINPNDAFIDFQNKGAVFIDARTSREHSDARIEGSINADISEESFEDSINLLNKDEKYIVYCQSGIRSARAVSLMQKLGFKNVCNLKGGIAAWRSEGFPVDI